MSQNEREIDDFLDTEIKEYSIHVIKERAIPNIVDGLKPSGRKILFTANKVAKNYVKTFALAGSVISVGGYSKGDGSLPGAIATMTQDFVGACNVPWMNGSGGWGSRFNKDPASPRYTSSKISPNFEKYFTDTDLLTYSKEDGSLFQPDHYLPIVPTILLNGVEGIAVGFACEYQPYNLKDIIKNVNLVLNNKKQKEILPYFEGFKGIVEKIDGTIVQSGTFEMKRKLVTITELPSSYSSDFYNSVLIKLVESKKIQDFKDLTDKTGYCFEVTLNQQTTPEKVKKMLKLSVNLNENLNAISEDNESLLQFNNVNEIIEYFVKHRLGVMSMRKKYRINYSNQKIKELNNKYAFIDSVIKKQIPDTVFKKRSNLVDYLVSKGYETTLADLTFGVFNKEMLLKIKDLIKEHEEIIKFFTQTDEKSLFISDLSNLK